MAKTPKNAEKFPIQWDGDVVGGENKGDNIPSSVNVVWGSNSFTWGDVAFIQDIVDAPFVPGAVDFIVYYIQ